MRKVKVKKVAAIVGGVASVGAVAIGSVGLASVGFPSGPAHAGPPGWSTTSTSTVCQGNNPNDCKTPKNTDNQGIVEESTVTSGPTGQLKQDPPKTHNVHETSGSSGPGNSQHDR
jgi:hypothetical protein